MPEAHKPPLTNRLRCCAEQVALGARVADIGADHGYLSIALLQSGQAAYVHACDLREKPIRRAMENAARYGVSEGLTFSCADGLQAIAPDEVDTVVCAGMGGDLIAQILAECDWIHHEKYQLILQPQSSGNDLRRKLFAQGFRVEREILVEDGGFLYCVLCARFGGARPLTPGQQYVPPQLLQSGSPLLPAYIGRIERALRRTVAGIRHASDPSAAERLAYYASALDEVREMQKALNAGPPTSEIGKEPRTMTVQTIYEFLQTLAPEYMAAEWDHVGLLCGRSDCEVRRVLVALDPFFAVCREAKERDCQLLVTHHPAIWKLDAVNDRSIAGRNLLYLIENGISAVNAHTNLDHAPNGVNDCLAKQLGLANVLCIDPIGTDAQGRPYGLLRGGDAPERTPEAFAAFVKAALGCSGVRWADGGKPVRRVAVGGGSCGDSFARVAALGYDAFVTADVKYNQFADAAALGLTLVDAGHFETENPVCTYLAAELRRAFPELAVLESETHRDPINFL